MIGGLQFTGGGWVFFSNRTSLLFTIKETVRWEEAGRLADICTGARMKWLEVSVRASKNNKTTDLNPVEVNFSGTESRDLPDPHVKAPV